jgi:hypothetical protein
MSETDNPLKLLITVFADAFAAWLLDRPVQAVRPLNVEFPANPLRGDLLFEVLDLDGRLPSTWPVAWKLLPARRTMACYRHLLRQRRTSYDPRFRQS